MVSKKKEIRRLLEQKDFSALEKLPSIEKNISILISLSYDKQSALSWRAIEAIGLLTAALAKTNPDRIRNIVGRLLWMIRDESGGIGWSVPEILGEIVRNNPVLCQDIAPIIASFHDEKMLTPGVLRAMGRVGRINDETIRYAVPIIRSYLDADDPVVRGLAVNAAAEMGDTDSLMLLDGIKQDSREISLYEDGELVKTTVGRLSAEAAKRLTEEGSRRS